MQPRIERIEHEVFFALRPFPFVAVVVPVPFAILEDGIYDLRYQGVDVHGSDGLDCAGAHLVPFPIRVDPNEPQEAAPVCALVKDG